MIYLILALLFSTGVFITFKYFNKFGINILPAITVNYLMATLYGYVNRWDALQTAPLYHQPWAWMAALAGFTFILTFVVFAISTQKVGVAMSVVSSKTSIVLSVAVGFMLLGELYNLLKIAGISTAIIAFYLTNTGQAKAKIDKKYLYLPVLIFLGTGANDSLMKLSGSYYPTCNGTDFITVAFFVALILGVILLAAQWTRKKITPTWKDLVAGILLSIFNWSSSFFFIKGLYILPISVFVPMFNATLVLIAALLGFFIFSERLSITNRIGIALAVIAIALIAGS